MRNRNSGKNTAVAVVWLLLGVAGMIGAAALVLVGVPDRLAEQRALDAATACSAAPQEPAECLWEQEFAISDIQLYAGRNSDITAMLTDSAGGEWPTGFGRNEPLLDDLDDGDRVVGTIWRGRVVEIAALGDRQETQNSPAGFAESYVATAFVVGPSGLLMIVAAGWRLRRRAEPAAGPGLTGLLWFTGGLAGATVVIGVAVATAEKSIWLIPGLWGVAAVLLAGVTVLAVRWSSPVGAALNGTDHSPSG